MDGDVSKHANTIRQPNTTVVRGCDESIASGLASFCFITKARGGGVAVLILELLNRICACKMKLRAELRSTGCTQRTHRRCKTGSNSDEKGKKPGG